MAVIDLGGASLPAGVSTQAFYGFRLDPQTSKLTVEVIARGSDVIRLPEDGVINPRDYKQWIWTNNTLQFQINNGRLEMTVL